MGASNDPLELEADAEADRVARVVDPKPLQASETPILRKATGPAKCGEAAPPIVGAVLDSPGNSLDPVTHRFMANRFGADFSDVRIHSDARAAQSAAAVNARAYTSGNSIVFAAGQYDPTASDGRRLLAHELAHVVQQRSTPPSQRVIQRKIAEADLPKTAVETIMADPDYFENGIESIEFFSAELARLHYPGGKQIDLGLVPEWIEPPFIAVDYRTLRSDHAPMVVGEGKLGTGSIKFVPRAAKVKTGPKETFADVVRETARTVNFTIHKDSGRIVPTEVNSISAPRLSAALRGAEAQYVQQTDEIAAGAVKIFKSFEKVILLRSLLPGGSLASTAAEGAAGGISKVAATAAERRAIGQFSSLFGELTAGTAKGGAELMVEGVGLSGIRATVQGSELVSSYSIIVNVGKVAGRGRLMHGAFEAGCLQAAKQAGLRSARVAVELVQNPKWAAYLESLGYNWEVISLPPSLATRVLTKVFTL